MNKDEIKKDEIKKGLECCSVIDFETGCSGCPYCYRCRDLCKDALDLITEREKEIDRLKIQLEQANAGIVNCGGCKLVEINVVRDFAEKLKARITKFIWRHNIPKCIFNDIMSDLLKRYEE